MNLLLIVSVAVLIFYAATASRFPGAMRSLASWAAVGVGAAAGLVVGFLLIGLVS